MSTYTVKSGTGPRGNLFWVVTTGSNGQEYTVSKETTSNAQAERWCTELNRAFAANEARRAAIKRPPRKWRG